MTDPLIDPDDLGTYLGVENVDYDRAALAIQLATTLCAAIVSPLPAGAEVVIYDVAQRIYGNPTNAQSETVGPYSRTASTVGGGSWLTRENKLTLRMLNGGGGAFSIDMLPASYTLSQPPWDQNGWFPTSSC